VDVNVDELPYLPRTGVQGTLYLYLQPWGRWGVLTWTDKEFHTHGQTESAPLEGNVITFNAIQNYADTLLWAKDWPRVICRAVPEKVNPCIRVEFEYQDGRIQRLTGTAAEKWLKDVNGVLAAQAIRYGQTQILHDHPWEFSRKDDQ
jgi:hypothetical protein